MNIKVAISVLQCDSNRGIKQMGCQKTFLLNCNEKINNGNFFSGNWNISALVLMLKEVPANRKD